MPSKGERKRARKPARPAPPREGEEPAEVAPISREDFKALLDWLDMKLVEECDDTPRFTWEFLAERRLPAERIVRWLGERGGCCDCQILRNVEEAWDWMSR